MQPPSKGKHRNRTEDTDPCKKKNLLNGKQKI